MWFAPSRRSRAHEHEAAALKVCCISGCPRAQGHEATDTADRRSVRAYAARQYALVDTLQCPCRRPLRRGLVV